MFTFVHFGDHFLTKIRIHVFVQNRTRPIHDAIHGNAGVGIGSQKF